MANYALYYPTIEFQNYSWLWSASLLWDRIYRIVPESYEYNILGCDVDLVVKQKRSNTHADAKPEISRI